MAKQQGKVKSIPAKGIVEGMYVCWQNVVDIWFWGIISSANKVKDPYHHCIDLRGNVGDIVTINFKDLRVLVIEYDYHLSTKIQQLPLKRTQWQSAFDNKEVDTDKIVRFQIRESRNLISGVIYNTFARIIPERNPAYTNIVKKKERLYTLEDVKSIALHYAMDQQDRYGDMGSFFDAWIEKNKNLYK